MDKQLFQEWLDEEVKDLHLALTLWGIAGILGEFETWLKRKKYIES